MGQSAAIFWLDFAEAAKIFRGKKSRDFIVRPSSA
jgi:hypothetical protein